MREECRRARRAGRLRSQKIGCTHERDDIVYPLFSSIRALQSSCCAGDDGSPRVAGGKRPVVLLPLLTLLGLGAGHPDNFVATAIPALLRVLGMPFTLPIVLGLFVLFMSGQLWLRRWLDVFVAKMENGFVVQLRAQLYEAMVHADWLFFTRQRGSEITQVLTDEVERIGSGTQQMLGLLSTVGVGLVQLVFAFLLAPGLTALAICCGGLLLLADRPVTRRTEGLGEEAQEKRLRMTLPSPSTSAE